jgi:hypothetical protein
VNLVQGDNENRLQLRGRVLTRAELERRVGSDPTADITIASARAELRYERQKWLRIVIEAEFARRSQLRDAFVRLRKDALRLRVGNFKAPGSIVQLDSIWTLPVVRRGLLDDVLADRLQIGGRRPGAALELEGPKSLLEPEFELGVHQSSGSAGDLLEEVGFATQTLAARAGVGPKSIRAAVFGELRPTAPIPGGELERFWAAGADARLDLELDDRYGLRVWAEAVVGNSWYDDDLFDDRHATFVAARLIGAWRSGGLERGQSYIESFAMFGAVDPDTLIVDDSMWEIVGGVNIGQWQKLRFTLQGEARRVSRNVPRPLDPLLTTLVDRSVLTLQLGAAF